jgi:SEC-C motif-containing protein
MGTSIPVQPASQPTASCPCGSGAPYDACCGPLHGGTAATSAEALMRSRYSAYVLGLEDYLLASWHAGTRPQRLDLAAQQPPPHWLGLSVKHHRSEGNHAEVEFVARLRHGGGRAQRLHERSRFVRENGRWFYVDGELDD